MGRKTQATKCMKKCGPSTDIVCVWCMRADALLPLTLPPDYEGFQRDMSLCICTFWCPSLTKSKQDYERKRQGLFTKRLPDYPEMRKRDLGSPTARANKRKRSPEPSRRAESSPPPSEVRALLLPTGSPPPGAPAAANRLLLPRPGAFPAPGPADADDA